MINRSRNQPDRHNICFMPCCQCLPDVLILIRLAVAPTVLGRLLSTTQRPAAAAASLSGRREESRVDGKGRGHQRSVGIRPVSLRWTDSATEPKEAA